MRGMQEKISCRLTENSKYWDIFPALALPKSPFLVSCERKDFFIMKTIHYLLAIFICLCLCATSLLFPELEELLPNFEKDHFEDFDQYISLPLSAGQELSLHNNDSDDNNDRNKSSISIINVHDKEQIKSTSDITSDHQTKIYKSRKLACVPQPYPPFAKEWLKPIIDVSEEKHFKGQDPISTISGVGEHYFSDLNYFGKKGSLEDRWLRIDNSLLIFPHPHNLMALFIRNRNNQKYSISQFFRRNFSKAEQTNNFQLFPRSYRHFQCPINADGSLTVTGNLDNIAIFAIGHSTLPPSKLIFKIKYDIPNLVNSQICIIHGSHARRIENLANHVQHSLDMENNITENAKLIFWELLENEFVVCSKLAMRQASSNLISK